MKQGIAITRAQLAKSRREAADRIQDENDKGRIDEVIRLHLAIHALDAVLAERGSDATSPWDDPKFSLKNLGA